MARCEGRCHEREVSEASLANDSTFVVTKDVMDSFTFDVSLKGPGSVFACTHAPTAPGSIS